MHCRPTGFPRRGPCHGGCHSATRRASQESPYARKTTLEHGLLTHARTHTCMHVCMHARTDAWTHAPANWLERILGACGLALPLTVCECIAKQLGCFVAPAQAGTPISSCLSFGACSRRTPRAMAGNVPQRGESPCSHCSQCLGACRRQTPRTCVDLKAPERCVSPRTSRRHPPIRSRPWRSPSACAKTLVKKKTR